MGASFPYQVSSNRKSCTSAKSQTLSLLTVFQRLKQAENKLVLNRSGSLSGKMRSDIVPDSPCLNSITAEQNMVLIILSGVLLVLFFLCISNFAIPSMPIKSDRHEYPTLEQERSTTTATYRIRFVTLVQGVTKAIGTAFDRRPSGRKVAEPAAIALMTPRTMQDFARMIRPHFHH